MGKSLIRIFSMIASHSAAAHTPESHPGSCQMDNRIIDTASAKRKFPQYSFFILPAGSKKIECQRLFLFFQLPDHFIYIRKGQHRKHRPENLFLHNGCIPGYPIQNRRSNLKRLLIAVAPFRNLLAVRG